MLPAVVEKSLRPNSVISNLPTWMIVTNISNFVHYYFELLAFTPRVVQRQYHNKFSTFIYQYYATDMIASDAEHFFTNTTLPK